MPIHRDTHIDLKTEKGTKQKQKPGEQETEGQQLRKVSVSGYRQGKKKKYKNKKGGSFGKRLSSCIILISEGQFLVQTYVNFIICHFRLM